MVAAASTPPRRRCTHPSYVRAVTLTRVGPVLEVPLAHLLRGPEHLVPVPHVEHRLERARLGEQRHRLEASDTTERRHLVPNAQGRLGTLPEPQLVGQVVVGDRRLGPQTELEPRRSASRRSSEPAAVAGLRARGAPILQREDGLPLHPELVGEGERPYPPMGAPRGFSPATYRCPAIAEYARASSGPGSCVSRTSIASWSIAQAVAPWTCTERPTRERLPQRQRVGARPRLLDRVVEIPTGLPEQREVLRRLRGLDERADAFGVVFGQRLSRPAVEGSARAGSRRFARSPAIMSALPVRASSSARSSPLVRASSSASP